MTQAVYFIFFIIIPVVCLIFRFRRKISTGFAFSGILTSFLLGLLIGGTFLKDPWEELIVYLNRNDLENAKTEFRRILQDNPEYLSNVKEDRLDHPGRYRNLKRELEQEYLDIVRKYVNGDKNFPVQTGINNINCNELQAQEKYLAKLKNAMRLLNMAEIIGRDQSALKEKLGRKIDNLEKSILRSKEKCMDNGSSGS